MKKIKLYVLITVVSIVLLAWLLVVVIVLVKCRMRVPFVTQESLFVNENLIL